MAFDEGVAQRVRETLEERFDLTERKMFGGLAFLLGGNMCVGRGVAFAGSLPAKQA